MSTPVTLPALGESVTEGTVSRWLKQVGDSVEVDEPLVEISTDKVDTEIPSPAAGTLLEIMVDEDETCEVGAVLATIGDEGEAPAGGDAPAEADPVAEPAAPSTEKDPEQVEAEAKPDSEPEPEPQSEPEPEKPAGPAASGPAEGTEVTLPALGESVTEGTVSRWLKQVGDSVEADEPLVEISTDKVDTEIPSPAAGTLLEIRVAEDETCEVGGVLAVIGDEGAAPAADAEEQAAPAEQTNEPAAEPSEPEADAAEKVAEEPPTKEEAQQPEAAPEPEAKPEPEPAEAPAEPKPAPSAPKPAAPRSQGDDSAYVTPLVRRLAKEKGVDLAQVEGSGVGGRIRKQDVMAAAEKPAEAPKAEEPEASAPAGKPAQAAPAASAKAGTTEKVTRLRATIARRMKESLAVSAQLTATVEVDLTAISRIRKGAKDDFKAREGASLSYLPFIAKAAVEGLKQFPKLNATIDTEAGQITYAASEDLGVAVDTDKGLLVPVIKDAGDLNVGGLAKKIGDLAARTRSNKVSPDELTGGTFTITNYGSAGTLMDTPIINQPQVAILGTGALVKRPVVISDDELGDIIAVRDMMYLSLTYDHRLVDGADAARYLSFVKARLEEGDFGAEFGL